MTERRRVPRDLPGRGDRASRSHGRHAAGARVRPRGSRRGRLSFPRRSYDQGGRPGCSGSARSMCSRTRWKSPRRVARIGGEFPPELIDPLLRAADSLRRHVEGGGEDDGDLLEELSASSAQIGRCPPHAPLLFPSLYPPSWSNALSASPPRSSTGCSTSSARPCCTAGASSMRSATSGCRRPSRSRTSSTSANACSATFRKRQSRCGRFRSPPSRARSRTPSGTSRRPGGPRSSSSSPAPRPSSTVSSSKASRADRPYPAQLGRARHRNSGRARTRRQAQARPR